MAHAHVPGSRKRPLLAPSPAPSRAPPPPPPALFPSPHADLIFDKFECGWSGDVRLVTGSYHRRVHIFEPDGSSRVTIEADKHATPVVTPLRSPRRAKPPAPEGQIEPVSGRRRKARGGQRSAAWGEGLRWSG